VVDVAQAARVFGRLDYALWERLGHNPIRLLREIGRPRLNQAAKDKEYRAIYDRVFKDFDSYMDQTNTWTSQTHPQLKGRPIAYFSWSLACMKPPDLFGWPGVGWRSFERASDLGLPLTVLASCTQGYFSQRITRWLAGRPLIIC
jgi:starch phosphorylase